jgi:uncharacterized protein
MIIDGHMHIGRADLLDENIVAFLKTKGNWEDINYRISPEGLIETLDQAGIDKGVIFPLSFLPPHKPWQDLNDLTALYVQRYPEKLIGYAIINPRDVQASLKELERSFDHLGLVGIKIHPSIQEFYPNDPAILPIFDYAQTRRVPVLVHTGASAASHPDIYSRPMLLDEIACRFTKLIIILAHVGRPFYSEAALLIRKYSNVYGDICANVGRRNNEALLAYVLLSLQVYASASDRLIFGSDHPIFSPGKFLQQFHEATNEKWAERWGLDPLSSIEKEQILGSNLHKILNLHMNL